MAYTDIDKPSDYFVTNLYTGNSGTQTISGLDFQPDFLWIKDRNATSSHYLCDAVRGSTKRLRSDTNAAEATLTNAVTSFTSDGFAMGNHDAVNSDGTPYVAWNWKAGTSVSGDTTGSGTLKTYTGSVNTTSGFSIIKYTGNGTAGHTIPHHLGVAPSAIFVKKLNELGDWSSYHSVLGNAGYMRLNNTNAFATASTYWNNTSPTSSVFTTGTTGNINGSGSTYIAYCFAEKKGYSKVGGSYTGNGNVNGSYIHLGFKPAWVMIKLTSGAGEDWKIYDDKRLGYNAANKSLAANTNAADSNSNISIDILSNGFKNRNTSGALNSSGATYIYMAFAENPFTTSTGIPATAR